MLRVTAKNPSIECIDDAKTMFQSILILNYRVHVVQFRYFRRFHVSSSFSHKIPWDTIYAVRRMYNTWNVLLFCWIPRESDICSTSACHGIIIEFAFFRGAPEVDQRDVGALDLPVSCGIRLLYRATSHSASLDFVGRFGMICFAYHTSRYAQFKASSIPQE